MITKKEYCTYSSHAVIIFKFILACNYNFTQKHTSVLINQSHSCGNRIPTSALGFFSQLLGLPIKSQKLVDIKQSTRHLNSKISDEVACIKQIFSFSLRIWFISDVETFYFKVSIHTKNTYINIYTTFTNCFDHWRLKLMDVHIYCIRLKPTCRTIRTVVFTLLLGICSIPPLHAVKT